MKGIVQNKLLGWVEGGIRAMLGDIAVFADNLYSLFVIVCLIGIYLSMIGDKEKGARISSISFLSYLIVKVMADVYAK